MGSETVEVPTTLRRVALTDIRENKTALRVVDRESQEYQELLNNIKKEGVLQSILVRECEDAETKALYYGLVDGLHRLNCAKDAGFTHLDCKVIVANDLEVLKKQIIMNIQRIETKPVEYSRQLNRMLALNHALTVSELADMIGKSLQFIYERMGLLKLNEKIAKLVDEGQIPLANAYALAKLPSDEQSNFLDRAITQQPAEFIPATQARVKELREAHRKGKDAAPAGFVPVARLRKLTDIKDEFNNPTVVKVLSKECKSIEDAFAMAIKWCLHMDPTSIAADQAKDEARRKEAEAAKERRKLEREEKAKKDAINTALGVKGE